MLSAPTRQLVNELYELAGRTSWFGRASREEEICSLLFKLAHSSESGALPYVVQFLFFSSANVRSTAQTAVESLLSQVSPYDLLQAIDLSWDEWQYYWGQWRELSPNEVLGLATNDQNALQPAVLGLLSFHRNGFVRHEAVRLLATIEDGTEFPFLLIRQNDWVAPIAVDAKAAIENRITDAYLPHLVKSLRLILHLKKFSRQDHSTIVGKTVGLLLKQENDEILRVVVNSPIRDVRREIVRLGLESIGENRIGLLRCGLKSNDPLIRLACCRWLPQFLKAEHLESELSRLATDPFMPLRRQAMQLQAEHFPTQAISIWRKALLDTHGSIRDLARFSLSRLGEEDHAGYYRQTILENPRSLAAIEGLSEIGDADDAPLFRQLLKHEIPNRRCAGIRGLSRVAGESAIPEMLDSLKDEAHSAVREAAKALKPHLYSVGGEHLLAAALEARSPFACRMAIDAITNMGKWPSFPWLIRVATQADPEFAKYAEEKIESWHWRQVFTRPSDQQRQQIQDALAASGGRLSQRVTDIIKKELSF